METRFGHSFAHVRVHPDGPAAESARYLNAAAYTVGRDIVFGAGRYQPGTRDGRRLLAHALSHVVQQRGTRPALAFALTSPLLGGAIGSPWEREADAVAHRVAAGRSAWPEAGPGFPGTGGAAHAPLLQRTPLGEARSQEAGSPGSEADAPVLPWNDTILDAVVFTTRMEPDGKVRISYPARLVKYILQDSEFTTEFRQFGGAIFGQGVVFEPGQLIKVHNHESGEIVSLRVADLARFENRKGWTFLIRVAKTAALAYSIEVVGARLTAGAAMRLAEGLTVSTASKAAMPLGHLALNEGLNAALSIAPNVISQVSAYGLEFEKYNKGSIAFDLILGVVGGRVANAVTKALPLRITRVADLIAVENVKNFTAQQTVFYLYGMLTAYAKALVANTNQSAQETAATIENAWSAGKSVAGQAIFPTPFGQQRFPQGFQSFSWRLIDKVLSLIFKTFLNQWLNVTPKASPDAASLASAEDRAA
jgi:hypothetical protein